MRGPNVVQYLICLMLVKPIIVGDVLIRFPFLQTTDVVFPDSEKELKLRMIPGTEICRICMIPFATVFEHKLSRNVFESSLENLSYSEIYEICIDRLISKHHNGQPLPTNICGECEESLLQSYKFKLQCLRTEELLINAIEEDYKDEDYIEEVERHVTEADTATDVGPEFLDALVEVDSNEAIETETTEMPLTQNSEESSIIESIPATSNCNSLMEYGMVQLYSENTEFLDENMRGEESEFEAMINSDDEFIFDIFTPSNKLKGTKTKTKKFTSSCEESQTSEDLIPRDKVRRRKGRRLSTESTSATLCPICGKTLKLPSMARHISAHKIGLEARRDSFVCDICGKGYAHKSALKSHQDNVHLKNKSYTCGDSTCIMKFDNYESYRYHKNKYHNENINRCSICNYTCVHLNSFKIHMRVHTGEEPPKNYKCSFESCTNAYSNMSHLKAHESYFHLGVRLYKCDLCDKEYVYSRALAYHKKSKHKEIKDALCPLCPAAFCRNVDLRGHISRKHQEYELPPIGTKITKIIAK